MSNIFPSWYAESASSWTMARARKFAKRLEAKSGSPIETILGASVLVAAFETGFPLRLGSSAHSDEDVFILDQQVNISKYRVDYLITGGEKKLIIECDGRDFHHATREQIERDRTRDAELSALGYTVFRFPGTQITSDIWTVVFDVLSWLDAEAFSRWYKDNMDYLA